MRALAVQRVALIVNPHAGRAQHFAGCLNGIMSVLTTHGMRAELFHTSPSPASTWQLAREAAALCDLVLACGGDGTIHNVLQGVANTQACLGVLPFGTANALARSLGLPAHPIAALQKLLTYTPTEIPLGVAKTGEQERWFTVMAGAGPDGRLVHDMKLAAKSRIGRSAYYMEAGRLFLMRSFPAFRVEYRVVGAQDWRSLEAVAMMAARIHDLGGIFSGLTPGSNLHHPHLVAQILAAPARVSLPAWIALGRSGLRVTNPWLTTLEVEELRCSSLESGSPTYAQVDGEAFGSIPLSIRVQPKGLRLLMRGE